MPDLALDLRYLRYAIAVVEHGSFRQTAIALNISQSTVTRRIQLLERRLGFALFNRDSRGVRLTHAGENFLKEAVPGVDQLRRAIRLSSARNGPHNGELRIGILASLAAGFLHLTLKEFRSRFPQVKAVLHESTAETNLHRLATGELDIAFVTGLPNLPRHKAEVLWKERIFVVLPKSHPLASKDELRWDEIRSEPFIVSSNGPGPEIQDYLVAKIAGIGFRPSIDVHDVGRESLLNLVAIGYGLTLTSTSALGLTVEGVVFRAVADSAEELPSSAIWSEANTNPALTGLVEIARSIASDCPEKLADLPYKA
ncbi:HTH-type transcriptional regulator GltC [Hartmannibacter diazotrophicus]|uniref:HTH-type transcriptional regulator GltC n=1 Tax=Hartmannibacter diazotrophicus TaxID=1482074 RepID=A0A2C9D4T3_9HYPH|nr:LysR family transcriptional regulator [Hartmannibacter diazotrophicus]SON55179.1 HTH-type transcriptional regulator GltC [Hartmannibacter diazotrophicus]